MGNPLLKYKSATVFVLVVAACITGYVVYGLNERSGAVDALKTGGFIERLQAFKKTELAGLVDVSDAASLAAEDDTFLSRAGVMLLGLGKKREFALRRLKGLYEAGNEETRRQVVFAIGELGTPAGESLCVEALSASDEILSILARNALRKIRKRLTPSTGPRPASDCLNHIFGPYLSARPVEYAGSKEFKRRLVEFMDNCTRLDVSSVDEKKVRIRTGETGSNYNDRTGVITLLVSKDMIVQELLSHLVHECAVINLGKREHYGVTTITPSFTHDLAVLTEIAHARATCVPLSYLWKQAGTVRSVWTRYTAEKLVAKLVLTANGGRAGVTVVTDATLFPGDAGSGKNNFRLTIELSESAELSKFLIERIE